MELVSETTVPDWSGAEVVVEDWLEVPSELVVVTSYVLEPSSFSTVSISDCEKEPSAFVVMERVSVVVEPSWFSMTVCVSVVIDPSWFMVV